MHHFNVFIRNSVLLGLQNQKLVADIENIKAIEGRASHFIRKLEESKALKLMTYLAHNLLGHREGLCWYFSVRGRISVDEDASLHLRTELLSPYEMPIREDRQNIF